MIDRFNEEYSFLSNFHTWPFLYRHVMMPTAEHAFQADKAQTEKSFLWIAESQTPGIAKRRGRQISLRPDWDSIKLTVMMDIVIEKFNHSSDRMKMLEDTGDQMLIEGNYWHDNFWGICKCNNCPGDGKNYLGKILMHVRNNSTDTN